MPENYREYLHAGEEIGSLFSMSVPSGVFDGLGGNRFSNRTGSSLEFMEHRDYIPGDDLRRLDWSAYARTDRLMVKQYREEVCPRLELLLDTSSSMALDNSEKSRSTLFIAAALISAAVNSGFTVRVHLCRDTLEPIPGDATRPASWDMINFSQAWNPGIALGNAYGSNITNIALILGITALISPIAVHSQVLRKELPILALVTGLAAWQLLDGEITRLDALVLLGVFGALMTWTIWQGMRKKEDALASEIKQELEGRALPLRRAIFWLVAGLLLLIVSSRVLVWGAVEIAQGFGVSDLIIGLTIIAVGTSLPELASSIIAARKGEHDIALGNILGSNLFNTLAVVGIAGTIHPLAVGPEVFNRDMLVMAALTLSLFVIGYGFRGQGRINRVEGALLMAAYIGYTLYLLSTVFSQP